MTSWFERRLGFAEESPEQVRAQLALEDEVLVSRVNGARLGCGWLELPRLDELRRLDRELPGTPPSRVSEVVGDSAALHRAPDNAGALFQAASQFNLLEMVSPSVTPERGVGIYEHDPTQGPACAIACGGGTIYRNYFAEVDGGLGQTAERQIDCLRDLGAELGDGLWRMSNGYALATAEGLERISARLDGADDAERERLRGLLRIGVQHDVDVLDTQHRVTQVYGSALPVAYGSPPASAWEPFARLVLEASYEATLRAARIWQCTPVFLTFLGGGVFGNAPAWIEDAIARAVERVRGLDVRLVSYGGPSEQAARIVRRCASDAELSRSRTSRSHPIRVDFVEVAGGPPVGMTFAPGKVQPHAITGAWSRSLELDLRDLARVHRVDDLVCLLEDHELSSLHIEALADRAAAHGIALHRLPIQDGGVPGEHELRALLERVASWRAAGRRVVFHCKGGLGRAGTAAWCCLIHSGVDQATALKRVRTARKGAVETAKQERFARDYTATEGA
jgi:protein-tyrosine phosphatase